MSVWKSSFGKTTDGHPVAQFVLENKRGMKAVLLDYGAVLTQLYVPDKSGNLQDVVWGYDTVAEYERNGPGFGATIGRNANRIKGAQVTIGGITYALEKNNGENNLHGGTPGYHRRLWIGEAVGENAVNFRIVSPDGDQGFPGTAKVSVTYMLTEENELRIFYEASADSATVMNMTNHSYFNLDGQESDSVLKQELKIDAKAFTPTDAELIPTGEIRSVVGTPMDFQRFHAVGERISAEYEPLQLAGGYDHNFVLNSVESTQGEEAKKRSFRTCCWLKSQKSGICMEVSTDLPGMQVYSANFLNQEPGKNGKIYGRHSAICFETQYFPDAVHQKNFASPIVEAGEFYRTTTGYKFSICE